MSWQQQYGKTVIYTYVDKYTLAESSLSDEHGNALKTATVQDMLGMCRQIWQYDKHLLYQTDMETDEKAIFPCPGPFNYEH
jgi:hypothetical protein